MFKLFGQLAEREAKLPPPRGGAFAALEDLIAAHLKLAGGTKQVRTLCPRQRYARGQSGDASGERGPASASIRTLVAASAACHHCHSSCRAGLLPQERSTRASFLPLFRRSCLIALAVAIAEVRDTHSSHANACSSMCGQSRLPPPRPVGRDEGQGAQPGAPAVWAADPQGPMHVGAHRWDDALRAAAAAERRLGLAASRCRLIAPRAHKSTEGTQIDRYSTAGAVYNFFRAHTDLSVAAPPPVLSR